ncbi:MAG: UvrD-helicase domain-containing protein [Lentimicrobiaceae bacterium]|nr:UvrD-helicase domain-containing protein [Lentimicrobiaceae bacterium]
MFTLYKASAGSGKTSRLVVEYLALCLPQPEKFKHVLAITFTNNATAEMKSRIIETLSELAFEKDITANSKINHTYNQIVEKIAKHLPEDKQFPYIKNQSKILLEKILYEYDQFSISTIDAFFQRILRAFALEFGLNVQFNLEIETTDFFKETITVLLNRISKENKELTQRVLDLVENLMLEKGKWKTENEILKLLNLSIEEEVSKPLKQLQESKNNNFVEAKRKTSREIFRLKSQLKNFITNKDKKSEEYLTLKEQLKEQEFLSKNLYQLALLFDLKTIMDEIKIQDNRFFISETNATINEKLGNEEVPFIYEKIGNRYSYFFIDEFQDTSQLQWQNMIPLIKNALSGNNGFHEQGKVFLFGDVKQAIYRFRNGNADILQQLSNIEGYKKNIIPYAQPDQDYQVKLLDTNYRSNKKVIDFNNEFFSFLTSENGHFSVAKEYYEDVKQNVKPNAEEGIVTVCFQEEDDDRKFPEFMLAKLLDTVFDTLHRGYCCKDIAILVSSNDLASAVGAHLITNNLPVISVESLQLSASPEVNVVIATMLYLVSEEDKLAKLSMAQYFAKQHKLQPEDYLQYVQSEELFQHFLTLINIHIDRRKLTSLPLFTLLNEIYRIFSFSINNPFLIRLLDETEDFASKHTGTLSFFLEWWDVKGYKVALSTPQGIDAITVSTIHKSKGLEYPVVILPFSQYGTKKTKPNMMLQDQEHITGLEYDWVTLTEKQTPFRFQDKYEEESNKTMIDHLNKLYVAHTRASKELHIITEKANTKRGNYSKFLAEFCEEKREWNTANFIFKSNLSSRRQKAESRRENREENSVNLCDLSVSVLNKNQDYLKPAIVVYNKSKEQQKGIYIHNFLSELKIFPQNEKEIDFAVQKVDEMYREDLVQIFYKILNDKKLQPYFDPHVKVMNETSILFPNGNLLRPDRVVFLKDKVVVIDYKTGESHASHKEQIDQYCDAIRAMGYENVEGVVLYI